MPNVPESSEAPKPKPTLFGPIKLPPELFEAVEKRRLDEKLTKQAAGRHALREWAHPLLAKTGGVSQVEPAPVVAPLFIWWLTERARKQMNFRLPSGAPQYLKDDLRAAYTTKSRPRGRVFNSLRAAADLIPSIEHRTGTNPRARWLWDESPFGVAVAPKDLTYLARCPGVITSVVTTETVSGETVADVGP